jgi:hypothetical protein
VNFSPGFFDLRRTSHTKLFLRLSARVAEAETLNSGQTGFQITRSPDHQIIQSWNSLLIPCFGALKSRKPAFHAGFRARRKKFPVIFPVINQAGQFPRPLSGRNRVSRKPSAFVDTANGGLQGRPPERRFVHICCNESLWLDLCANEHVICRSWCPL